MRFISTSAKPPLSHKISHATPTPVALSVSIPFFQSQNVHTVTEVLWESKLFEKNSQPVGMSIAFEALIGYVEL